MTEPEEADWKMARHLAAVSSWAARDVEAIATIIATAKAEERAAVVAWLRDAADTPDGHARGLLLRIVGGLERGEHRRKGNK